MEYRFNLIYWLMVFCSFASIIAHRVFLSNIEAGKDATTSGNIAQGLVIAVFVLFLMMLASIAIVLWQKITAEQNVISEKKAEFPKVGLACALASFFIFSIYWYVIV